MKRRMVWLLTTSLALLVLQFQIAAQSKSGKPREAIIVPPEAGTRIGRGNWKLTKDQSGGSLAVSEVYNANASTDWGPGHVHTREDEIWYVIEGELSFKVGGRTATAGPGTLVFAPRGVPHQYIVSKAPARYLLIFTPAGIEPLFPEVDDLRNKVRQGSPEYYEKLEEMRAQYGVYAAKKWEGITSTEDPTDGTWDLDVRASKFEPGPAWKNQTRIYKADGKSIKMIATGVNSQPPVWRVCLPEDNVTASLPVLFVAVFFFAKETTYPLNAWARSSKIDGVAVATDARDVVGNSLGAILNRVFAMCRTKEETR